MDGEQGQLIDDGARVAKRIAIRQLVDGSSVSSIFRIDQVVRSDTKAGKAYLRINFGDATGALSGLMWDDVAAVIDICKVGAIVAVEGRFEINERYGPQLTVRSLRIAESHEFDPADLEDVPLFPFERLEQEFADLMKSVQQPQLAELLGNLIGPESETGKAFMQMPAAKKNHQAYIHGLLEHTLTVAQAVSAAAEIFPGIDRDLAVTGALLHDIGKLDAYEQSDGGIDLTDDGKLQGEIPLGYHRIKTEIERIGTFPPRLAQALLHIQLSHHGKLEHGSPVTPSTREAVLVSMMDNLGGTLGTYDRLEKSLAGDAVWSHYDNAAGGSAFFGHMSESTSSG